MVYFHKLFLIRNNFIIFAKKLISCLIDHSALNIGKAKRAFLLPEIYVARMKILLNNSTLMCTLDSPNICAEIECTHLLMNHTL